MYGLAVRGLVELIRVLVDGGDRNRRDFELKQAALGQGTESKATTRIRALRNHEQTDSKLSVAQAQYSVCCISGESALGESLGFCELPFEIAHLSYELAKPWHARLLPNTFQ